MNINLGAYNVGLVTEEVGAVAAIASSDVFNVLRLTLSKRKKKTKQITRSIGKNLIKFQSKGDKMYLVQTLKYKSHVPRAQSVGLCGV